MPFASANGNIAHSLIQELKKDYKITVVTRKNVFSLKRDCLVEGVRVIRFTDYNLCLHHYLSLKIRNSEKCYKRQWYRFLLTIKRIAFYVPRLIRMQSFSRKTKNKIKLEVERLNRDQKIDVIIPVSAPHEEVFAGVEIKKVLGQNVMLFIYQLDRYANNNLLYENSINRKIKYPNNLRLEVDAMNACDGLFILPALQEHYRNRMFEKYLSKIVVTEHPLVKEIDVLNRLQEEHCGAVNVLYAGSLYQKLRNPTYLFDILCNDIFNDNKVVLYLYSFGNCQHIIDKYKERLSGKMHNFDRVSSEEITKIMLESDILLTIGNNSENEVPSKLFEYLSFCKPIIHLYYSEKDAYLEYLKSYPYSLCLKMDENFLEHNSRTFHSFCIQNCDVKIDFEDIRESYMSCTPGYVAKQFVSLIENEQ